MRTALGPRSFFSRRTSRKRLRGGPATGGYSSTTASIHRPAETSGLCPLVGKPEPYPVVRTAADEHYGTLSPDGRWLAYISNETGAYEVYVESFPATGFKRQISTQGGFEPQWRRDGKELFYLAPNQTLMAVGVTSNATTLEVSPPKALFATRSSGWRFRRWHTITPPLPMVNAS